MGTEQRSGKTRCSVKLSKTIITYNNVPIVKRQSGRRVRNVDYSIIGANQGRPCTIHHHRFTNSPLPRLRQRRQLSLALADLPAGTVQAYVLSQLGLAAGTAVLDV